MQTPLPSAQVCFQLNMVLFACMRNKGPKMLEVSYCRVDSYSTGREGRRVVLQNHSRADRCREQGGDRGQHLPGAAAARLDGAVAAV